MIRYVLAAFVLAAAPIVLSAPVSAASESHQHKDGEKGPNGGVVQDVAGYEAELVTGGGEVTLYLVDHATNKPIATEGIQASILFVHGTSKKGTLALKPAGDKLEGNGAVPADSDAVVSIRLANGKSAQARFELGGHTH